MHWRTDVIRLVPLAAAAALLVTACGGSGDRPGTGTGSTPSPRAVASGAPNAGLPDSGSMVRLVNLYADDAGGQAVDVYGFAGSDIESQQVLVASVEYGQATDWFDPGYVEGSGGSHTVNVAVRLKGADRTLGGAADVSIVAGSRATFILGPSDGFGARMRVALDSHPDGAGANVPQPLPDAGLLVTSYEGLPPADFERSVFYASVGDYCLRGLFPDPEFEAIVGHPVGQPVGNPLAVEPGTHTLTIHLASDEPGAIETCQGDPVAQAALQSTAAGRAYAFLYAEPGKPEVKVLVVPFEE